MPLEISLKEIIEVHLTLESPPLIPAPQQIAILAQFTLGTPWLSNHLLSYTPTPGRLFMLLSGEEIGMTASQHPI